MQTKPYVGITGPTTKEEVKLILDEFSNSDYSMHTEHIPMLGFLVSYKTLNGFPTKNKRYPKISDLRELLIPTKDQALAMIHYNTKDESTLASQIERVFEPIYSEGLCRALQLNIPWPDLSQLNIIKEKYPELKILLQLSSMAMAEKSIIGIADLTKNYDTLIDYILIDPSGGRGKEFNIDFSVNLYQELNSKLPDKIVGFAGGLKDENVEDIIKSLTKKLQTTNFSIDAEGALRDKLSKEYGDDLLNLKKVKFYLRNASKVLK